MSIYFEKLKEIKDIMKATGWDSAYINSLPDSSFAIIKDDKRSLPFKDKDGKVSISHLRNALARLNQVKGLSKDEQEKVRAKLEKILKNNSEQDSDDSKMEDQKMEKTDDKYVAKFSDEKVDTIKEIVTKLRKMVEDEVSKEELTKLADVLEGTITKEATGSKDNAEGESNEDSNKDGKEESSEESDKKEEGDKKDPEESDKESSDDDKKEDSSEADNSDSEADKKDGDEDKKEEVKEESESKDESEESGEVKEKTEEKDAKDEEDTSKQSEKDLAYKEIAEQAIAKLKEIEKLYNNEKDKNEILTRDNLGLKESITKFEDSRHLGLIEETIKEMSKFKEMSEDDIKLKEKELSKMSDDALGIMKAEFEKINVSKMESEQLFETTPSSELDGKKVSKHSEEDPLVKSVMDHLKFR